MIRFQRRAGLALLLLALALSAQAQRGFGLRSGDHVVFYGDSITEQRLYTTFVETFVVTRFPKMDVRFVHSGIGGDSVGGGWAGPVDVRLERDVLAYRPTVMTVMLGMNDGAYRAFDDGIFGTYAAGYRHIADVMKRAAPRLRMTLIQPSPFDDVTRAPGFPGGYNGVLVAYGEFVSDLARTAGQTSANLNDPVVAVLARAVAKDAPLAAKIVPDRVHPGPGGHLIMAAALLKAWNAPSLVSEATLDARAARVAGAANASITGLERSGERLTWTQQDAALPFPLDAADAPLMLAVRCSDFVEALDRQILRVTGLTGARYALRIDNVEVGSFTPEELAAGVNLAVLPTPMAQQAARVHALTLQHAAQARERWAKDQARWKDMTAAEKTAFTAAVLQAEEAAVHAQREAARPLPHRYDLAPAP